MSDPLIFAIPSKGRLRESAEDYLVDCGLGLKTSGGRGYVARFVSEENVEVRLLSAGEIARSLVSGAVHIGVTGLDLIRETGVYQSTVEIAPLGFGFADVVVAAPSAWIDVDTMEDLEDVAGRFVERNGRQFRVATKYHNLTRAFFAELGFSDYLLVDSLGATEAAPTVGTAEAIVDITTTGATLAANNLKPISDGVILRSEATMFASNDAQWTDAHVETARRILDRIAARRRGRDVKEIRFQPVEMERELEDRLIADFGCVFPFPSGQSGAPVSEVIAHCPHSAFYEAVGTVKAYGAATVIASSTDYIFEERNDLFEALSAAVLKRA